MRPTDLVGEISEEFNRNKRFESNYLRGGILEDVLDELSFKKEKTIVSDWELFLRNKQSYTPDFLAVYDAGKYVVCGDVRNDIVEVESDLRVMKDYIFNAGALSRAVRHPLIDAAGSFSLASAGTALVSAYLQPSTGLELAARVVGFVALAFSGGIFYANGISKTANRHIESKLSFGAKDYFYGHDVVMHLHDCSRERRAVTLSSSSPQSF